MAEKRRQGFGLDPKELHIDFIDVQRDDGQAFGQTGRQQRAAAGEADSGLQVAGFETADILASQFGVVDCPQTGVNREDQFALRLKVAQTQFHQVVGEFPGTVDLAGLGIHQMQFIAKMLLRVQRHRETHRQGAGTVQLHFGNIHHA